MAIQTTSDNKSCRCKQTMARRFCSTVIFPLGDLQRLNIRRTRIPCPMDLRVRYFRFQVACLETSCLPRPNWELTRWKAPEDLFSMQIHLPLFSFMKSARVL